MMFKVELLSKEMMIKPSSPTPPHLKTLKLSFLDQISPPVFIPLIFFFQVEDDHSRTTSQLLKQSLSNVLSLFYPLAGRLKGNTSIDCNDAGALCVETRVLGFLKDVIENPLMEQLKMFIPFEPYGHHDELILAVQINYFLDGGLALGVCMSHKIGDGLSLVNFVNAWAVTARGGDAAGISQPNFGLMPSLFPPPTMDLPGAGFSPDVGMTREMIVTRRLVFDKEKLADLKKSAARSSGAGDAVEPTRVEALSAYFWKHFIEASAKKTQQTPIVVATHAVNLRARLNPPLPDTTFGNLWRPAIAVASPPEPTQDLVFQLRTSIRKINAEYAKALENGKEYLEHLRKASGMFRNGEGEFCSFSSWCRFPIYEVDFGWGRPVWACTTTLPYKNVTIFMSTESGDGIEAWVNMAEDDIYMGA